MLFNILLACHIFSFSESENHAGDEAQSTESSLHSMLTCEDTSTCTQTIEYSKCMYAN